MNLNKTNIQPNDEKEIIHFIEFKNTNNKKFKIPCSNKEIAKSLIGSFTRLGIKTVES